ncbi:MAG TPA: tetratricopeptide repeat protein [Terracidiphilus sp.]|nr:tetratricopeptide repeat protein [Terracidiphilus sp.]
MDTQTRRALKGDKFAQATKTSVSWVSGHRAGVMRWAISIGAIVVICLAVMIYWNVQSAAADSALGAAMDTYSAPLAIPGAPPEKGVYATGKERAKTANAQFVDVTKKYGWMPQGSRAHYFAGVTYEDLGQNGLAETELKSAAGAWDHNLANLANLALAGLYHQTGQDAKAIDIYKAIIAKPSVTVSAGVAQLDLADLYAATGKQDQARAIWAKVKDADKDGAAGSIAAQKLAGPAQ